MTEHEQRRLVRHRLAILHHAEEVTGNVSMTCRYYGISRQCFYKWRNRREGPRGFRVGRHIRYQWADVTEWIERQIENANQ